MVLLLVGSCEPWSRPLQKIFEHTRERTTGHALWAEGCGRGHQRWEEGEENPTTWLLL